MTGAGHWTAGGPLKVVRPFRPSRCRPAVISSTSRSLGSTEACAPATALDVTTRIETRNQGADLKYCTQPIPFLPFAQSSRQILYFPPSSNWQHSRLVRYLYPGQLHHHRKRETLPLNPLHVFHPCASTLSTPTALRNHLTIRLAPLDSTFGRQSTTKPS